MARRLLILLAVACGRTDADTTKDDVDSDPLVAACNVEFDELAYTPDPRLLRWPYTSNVTDTAVTVQWGLPLDVVGKLHWGTDGNLGTVSDAVADAIDGLIDPVQLHRVRLEGLEPNTAYCYRIEVDGKDISGPLLFHTAASKESKEPVKILVLGDYGVGIGFSTLVYNQIKPYMADIDLWLTVGDNAYSNGTALEWHNNHFTFYRDLLRRVPYYPAPGNHDYGSPLGLQPMLDSIDLPKQAYRAEDNGRYYAFDWGPVHVSVLDSQLAIDQVTPDTPDDDMVDWYVDDLAANQDRPWRIASWHHPLYNTEPGRSPKASMKQYLQPVVEAGNTQLALSGHSHVYEAFMHLKDEAKLSSGGTSYIVTGGGGANPDRIDGEEHAAEMALRDFGFSGNQFLLLTVDDCTLSGESIDRDGNTIHTFELTRACE